MKKGAVLVETRLLPNLKEIIDNHLMYLPKDWGLMVFCSQENKDFIEINYPTAYLVILGNHLDNKAYNEMLTSSWFWYKIIFDKVLIFQHDSKLLRQGIEEFLEWDYVGAPWTFQSYGGNGGLSLRTRHAMLDIIEKAPPFEIKYGNEDIWFCNIFKLREEAGAINFKMAPREVCEKFSVEAIYKEGTLGCHAIEKYLTPLECSTILSPLREKGSFAVISKPETPKPANAPIPSLEEIYNNLKSKTSDINEHLPILREYASKVSHITEFGFREVVSTYAFLAARPKKLITYDIVYNHNIEFCNAIANTEKLDFTYHIKDVLKTFIEPTELLFIDTLHTYSQLKRELSIHAENVSKYIIFHDTETYGTTPEPISWQSEEVKKNYIENDKGIWPAIEEFLKENPEWKLIYKVAFNNGLTILERV